MKFPRAWCIAAFLPQIGCALFSKSDAFVSRYFSPESAATPADPVATSGLELRLGHVGAASYIKEEIAFRDSSYEVGFYAGRRWTEKPEFYVRRALTRALFDRRGIRQVVYGAGTTLDVDVLAFDEVRAPVHVGRVQLDYSLVDHRVVRFSRSITVERPIADAAGDAAADAIVAALSRALVDSVDILADRIAAELRAEGAIPALDGPAAAP
jgi:cholesterol transport system auxiliary component